MAKDRMDLWLNDTQGNNIEVIISNNDAMAIGALASLKEHHKKLPIFSVDALPRVLRFVKSGDITGTVLNDGVTQSRVLVKLARDLAQGKPMNKGADWTLENNSIRTPDIAIDQDNIDKFLK
ncbi:putative D-galactose-binding periplasmic protein [Pasteurella bettyae CCUG 2042]|uniref:Putative D-galactose-binding periplasmic protein n=1 Tax=Pasteurella bettyae CCUG 2042 TaxID=1095749 RepID=I3D7Z4_9PAST|nr:putative D-galactose-binding periplasmic protein [Pasteurella bettyae CCUG 2042]SUB22172.1 D-galactose-binding periplasmic protein [Pasteurella bettyae]